MRVARSPQEIEDLAARMAAAEEDAFAEFVVTFGPRLRAFFIKKGLAASDAEDLSVSCVTDIALKVDKYKSLREGGFEAWVFTLARHSLIDLLRSRRNTEPLSASLTAQVADEEEDAGSEFAISLAVRDAVARLSAPDQLLIRLRHLEAESTYQEIATHLGISTEAARVRHFRAMKRLKSLLETDGRISRFLER